MFNKKKEKLIRGEKILQILEVIEDATVNTLGLFIAISTGLNYKMMDRTYKNFINNIGDKSAIRELIENVEEWQRFRSSVAHLKKDGLIVLDDNKWLTTPKGKEKIKKLGKKIILNKRYPVEASNNLIVFIYDIPERYRPEREWVRHTLNNLGYKMRQKSVWLGKNKIPKDFIKDLKKLRIADYVEFFAVTKMGTLK